jgi:hypothetical protein
MDVAEQALPRRLDDKRMSGRDRNGYLEGYSMKTRLLAGRVSPPPLDVMSP